MCKIDWHLLFEGLTAFGTIMVAVLAIWGDVIKKLIFKPRLIIKLEKPHREFGNHTSLPAWYYHLSVINTKPNNPALNCKVLLKKVITTEGEEIPIQFDLSFFWSPSDRTKESENVFKSKTFDFVVLMHENKIVPSLVRGLSLANKEKINAGQSVTFILQAVANELQSRPQSFKVSWNGIWPTDETETVDIEEV